MSDRGFRCRAARSCKDVDMFRAPNYFWDNCRRGRQMDRKRVCSSRFCAQALASCRLGRPASRRRPIGRSMPGHALDLPAQQHHADRAGLRRLTVRFQLENYNTYTGEHHPTRWHARAFFKLNPKRPSDERVAHISTCPRPSAKRSPPCRQAMRVAFGKAVGRSPSPQTRATWPKMAAWPPRWPPAVPF